MNVSTEDASLLPGLKRSSRMPPQRLSPAASLILDVVRFLAAVTVAMGHFSQSIFSDGLPNLMSAAAASVGVFFVLSGFIIRYVTLYRESSLSVYLADRASRLYSVVLPALGFTVVADLVARHLEGGAFSASIGEYLLRIFASLGFMSETWFQDLTPFGNGPFWSLSFEAFYYALYGVGFYLRGWKRVALLSGVALLAGPGILMLAPIWFLGGYLFDVYQALLPSRRRSLIAVAGILAGAAVAGVAVMAIPHDYRAAARAWAFHFNLELVDWKFYKVSTWYYEAGVPAGLGLLMMLLLFDRVKIPMKSRSVRFMRYVADGTFPLYLFHFPMLLLVRAAIPYNHSSRWQLALVFLGVIVTSILLGGVCNRLKDVLRGLMLKEV
jgi:peptidoglycan/LPS O-acetylase OafA/YrhL